MKCKIHFLIKLYASSSSAVMLKNQKVRHISDILSDLLSRHLHARESTQYF